MKKKILCLLLALVMVVGMVGILASCGGEEEPCTEHVDTNPADGKCDVCGETVKTDEGGNNNTPCTQHVDTNPADGKCDVCGTTVQVEGGGEEDVCDHIDDNFDEKCDLCGESMGTGSGADCIHEDLDLDDACDLCGADMSVKVVMKPLWNSATIIMQLNRSDNQAELSSELERYIAGTTDDAKDVDSKVDVRNYAATQETKVTPDYRYWSNLSNYDWGKSIDRIGEIVTSTTIKEAPDVYSTFIYDIVGASVKGYLANLKGTSRGEGELRGKNYFEFVYDRANYESTYKQTGEDRGFMYEWMESVTLSQSKMYALASDYFIDMVRAFFMIPVNVEMLEGVGEDITGDLDDSGEFTIDDFYLQVKNGEWTYDLLMEYALEVYQNDGNPNTVDPWLGDTRIGFAMADGGVANSGIIYTSSVTVIHKEWNETRNDYDYYYPETNDALADLADAITGLFEAEGVILVHDTTATKGVYDISSFGESHLKAIRDRFTKGSILFGDIMMVGALEFNEYQEMGEGAFGVVPVPIYHDNIDDEGNAIDRYLTQIHNVGRPGGIAYNTKKFVECTAFLNYQSTHSTEILNTYYTYELCFGAAGGAAGTVDMLNYLRANVRTSFDKAMEDAMGIFDATSTPYKVTVMMNGGSEALYSDDFKITNFANDYASALPEKKGFLEDLIGYFQSAKD
ncbi:MAG: hypothetical protein IJD51_05905 [Clostridia bacterium]|nr:hypothetical protein [Clostridia bacterium]